MVSLTARVDCEQILPAPSLASPAADQLHAVELEQLVAKREGECVEAKAELLRLRDELAMEALVQLQAETGGAPRDAPQDASVAEEGELERLMILKRELEKKLQSSESASVAEAITRSGTCSVAGTSECSSACASPRDVSPAASSSKGTGKGKLGKGKALSGKSAVPPAPAPKMPPPRRAAAVKRSNLTNLHWRVINEKPEESTGGPGGDLLLKQVRDLANDFALGEKGANVGTVGVDDFDFLSLQNSGTVFSACESEEEEKALTVPTSILEAYFTKRSTTVVIGEGRERSQQPQGEPLIDCKRLQMLGILLQRHLMANRSEADAQAIISLKRAVLRCDEKVVPQEGLSVLRTVLRQHASDGDKITAYVKEKGEAALQSLPHPYHHKLIHELLKIPQIEERMECMLFKTVFEESLVECQEGMAVVRQALDLLWQKRELLSKFFVTAHRLGSALNRDSRAPQAPRGFQLASLEKMAQTKCSANTKCTIMHFVLALLSPQDVEELFTSKDVVLLARARTVKSHFVYRECMDLIQSFQGTQKIVETGHYTSRATGEQVQIQRRRKTMAPSSRQDEQVDDDDRFHDTMEDFVLKHSDEVDAVALGCFETFQIYKNLGIWFDDLGSVYPPPESEKIGKADLLAVMHNFAESVRSLGEEVARDGLRDMLEQDSSR